MQDKYGQRNFTTDRDQPKILDIKHHDNFISEFYTNLNGGDIIDYYEYIAKNGLIVDASEWYKTGRQDEQELINDLPPQFYNDSMTSAVYQAWSHVTKQALKEYMKKYDVFSGRSLQQIQCKLQKTLPGQGFHYWHYEQTPFFGARQITTQLYLNDDFEGGETEFLYQHYRVKAESGKFTLCPSSWPWTHRGNPPIGGTKYIATSWIEELPTPKRNEK